MTPAMSPGLVRKPPLVLPVPITKGPGLESLWLNGYEATSKRVYFVLEGLGEVSACIKGRETSGIFIPKKFKKEPDTFWVLGVAPVQLKENSHPFARWFVNLLSPLAKEGFDPEDWSGLFVAYYSPQEKKGTFFPVVIFNGKVLAGPELDEGLVILLRSFVFEQPSPPPLKKEFPLVQAFYFLRPTLFPHLPFSAFQDPRAEYFAGRVKEIFFERIRRGGTQEEVGALLDFLENKGRPQIPLDMTAEILERVVRGERGFPPVGSIKVALLKRVLQTIFANTPVFTDTSGKRLPVTQDLQQTLFRLIEETMEFTKEVEMDLREAPEGFLDSMMRFQTFLFSSSYPFRIDLVLKELGFDWYLGYSGSRGSIFLVRSEHCLGPFTPDKLVKV